MSAYLPSERTRRSHDDSRQARGGGRWTTARRRDGQRGSQHQHAADRSDGWPLHPRWPHQQGTRVQPLQTGAAEPVRRDAPALGGPQAAPRSDRGADERPAPRDAAARRQSHPHRNCLPARGRGPQGPLHLERRGALRAAGAGPARAAHLGLRRYDIRSPLRQ